MTLVNMQNTKNTKRKNTERELKRVMNELQILKLYECFTFLLKNIGLNSVNLYLKYMNKKPAVSVGSGNGSFEKILEIKGINITCIDPTNNLKCPDGLKPKYDYVENALKKEPSLKGNNLILISPYTMLWMGKDGEYDIQAIKLLKPKQIFMLIDLSGTSGSGSILYPIIKSQNNIVIFDRYNKYKILKKQNKEIMQYDTNEDRDDVKDGGKKGSIYKDYGRLIRLNLLILEKIK